MQRDRTRRKSEAVLQEGPIERTGVPAEIECRCIEARGRAERRARRLDVAIETELRELLGSGLQPQVTVGMRTLQIDVIAPDQTDALRLQRRRHQVPRAFPRGAIEPGDLHDQAGFDRWRTL